MEDIQKFKNIYARNAEQLNKQKSDQSLLYIALQLSQYFLMKTYKDPQTDLQIETYPTILTGKNIVKQGL